ncbi:MAG: hypothetical protein L3J82_03415 [Planctomycetes bacterium]|nr:hypothetical protein [Planctomycetota bacterium]
MHSNHHNYRDMLRAIGLSFGSRRISAAGFGLLWTCAVLVSTLKLLTMFEGYENFSPVSIKGSVAAVQAHGPNLWFALICIPISGLWAIGFQWFLARVFRSGALQLSGLEDENLIPRHLQLGAAFLLPVSFFLPVVLLLFGPLWSLTFNIDGVFGTVVMAVTSPFALVPMAIGAVLFAMFTFACPLFMPAVMVDGEDLFDSVGRSISYVVREPCYYLWLIINKLMVTVLATVIAGIVLGIIWGAVAAAIWVIKDPETVESTYRVVTEGAGADIAPDWVPLLLGNLIWGTIGIGLCWVLVVSGNCDLMMYVILRQRIDNVPYEQVHSLASVETLVTAAGTAIMAEEAHKRWDAEQAEAGEKPEETAND